MGNERSDRIAVRGIRGYGYHGVLPRERAEGQEFIVDVTLLVQTRRAAASDDLEQTVNYADVAEKVHAQIVGEPVKLIETLAQRIAAACLADLLVTGVEVRVHKPNAPIEVPFEDVVVTIFRSR